MKFIGTVDGGKVICEGLKQFVTANYEGREFIVDVKPAKKMKTWEQLKAFHGPILEQCVKCIERNEGIHYTKERMKQELKDQFLLRKKRYYSNGDPVMWTLPHPDNPKITYETQLKVIPSLSELTKEEMTEFIQSIIEFYLHNYGWSIEIEGKEPSHAV